METIQGQGRDTEQKPPNTGFGPTTTAAEVISGIDLKGKVAIVTGGSAGIGAETARVLSGAGALVIVAARDPKKAEQALAGMKGVELWPLDLADPVSIDQFATAFVDSNRRLDLLINNAGIMATPLTRDARGYEIQFATNHLGHFQLTGRLWSARASGERPSRLPFVRRPPLCRGRSGRPELRQTGLRQVGGLRSVQVREFVVRGRTRPARPSAWDPGVRGPPRRDSHRPRSPHDRRRIGGVRNRSRKRRTPGTSSGFQERRARRRDVGLVCGQPGADRQGRSLLRGL